MVSSLKKPTRPRFGGAFLSDWLKTKDRRIGRLCVGAGGRIGGAGWAGLQGGLTQNIGVALAGFRKLDDLFGIASSVRSVRSAEVEQPHDSFRTRCR